MKITIVGGFFLPLPAAAGGATEKTWDRLSRIFARLGHDVTVVSRSWPTLSPSMEDPAVTYLHLPGATHSASLLLNLLKDLWWSWRVQRSLPAADIVIVNAVSLPVWLRRFKPQAGKLVIMTGRVPKGQFRLYHDVALAIAASTPVLQLVEQENPCVAAVGQVYGYPVDYALLAGANRRVAAPLRIGFVGRLHTEKGLTQWVNALRELTTHADLPPWQAVICGPASVAHGGSGEAYVESELQRLRDKVPGNMIEVLPPRFDADELAALYGSLDIFVLPSLAERGETFGVAAIEAMAAGAAVITSQLACFGDYLQPGHNGLSYDHRADDAATRLANAMGQLLTDHGLRDRLSTAGQETAKAYDYELFAQRLIVEFRNLLSPPDEPLASS